MKENNNNILKLVKLSNKDVDSKTILKIFLKLSANN
jgi:hypothetical protein